MNEKLNILSPQKRMFVLEYLKTFNARKASAAVGLAAHTGQGYLGETDVQEAMEEQMALRIERTQIDADWVLIQLGQMFNADLADLFEPGTNDLRPVHMWPEIWRKMASSVKVDNRSIGRGEDALEYTVKDLKIMDRLKALELIGRHTNVKAFTEKLEITTDQDLTDRLMAGRKRAKQRNNDDGMSFM